LLTVTEAEAQLYGLDRQALAQQWRQLLLLLLRLRHARLTEQARQSSTGLQFTLIGEPVLAGSVAATFSLWSRLRGRLKQRLERRDPVARSFGWKDHTLHPSWAWLLLPYRA
jgi:hypothetical protein